MSGTTTTNATTTNATANEMAFGMYKEYNVSIYVLLFMLLVLTSIGVSHVLEQRLQLHFISSSGAIIIVGLIAGALCSFDQSDIVARWLVGFDPNVFFVGLLPPIIFNSGYTMKRRHFFDNLTSILMFAILGTFISAVVVGGFLYLLGTIGLSLQMPLAECLAFGALISSTDPVTTLAVFQELHVDPKLFYIVFGESVLNDAISIVLFNTFVKFIGVTEVHAHAVSYAVLDFIGVCVGSILVGVTFGCLSSIALKHVKGLAVMHEVSLFVLVAYIPFLVAEVLELSGIVAILFAGMFMRHYTFNNLSSAAKDIASNLFHIVAFMCELVVFLNLGLSFFAMERGLSIPFMLWSLLACLVARAMHVYPLSSLRNVCMRRGDTQNRLDRNEQHMIWFSGLRGAIAFSLALSFPAPFREEVRAATMVVVVVTVLVMGGLTVKALDVLNIQRLVHKDDASDSADAVHSSISRHVLLKWDATYLMPWLTNAVPPTYDDVYVYAEMYTRFPPANLHPTASPMTVRTNRELWLLTFAATLQLKTPSLPRGMLCIRATPRTTMKS
ncbi:sodium/hydrogen exchanger 3, variant 3 [Aphanomyces invadans]|uniref:Sodium/hydrogen exchanger n=1 Tax=Aphanomyces invadans TaxID=157072 RepID=A0A024UTN0_9STRA|nr:sodium/hydrogen exchanger 3, variant 3 [Aphanomyces invadans]ETW09714.1 sodium/hydrogen exchanger 3, variant 3 [Aphanomyces invadans]|eukprot:XP_008861123.1 sodium/hydrogen exchanger 3, variant 3 [Aphanomyces invadans]